MKKIGLLWWMSRESSMEYYRMINEWIKENLWWLHSADMILRSVDFAAIENLQHSWDRDTLTQIMIDEAKTLEAAGAQWIVICTNTMHKMANDVQDNISAKLIHIADSTAKEIMQQWIKKVALLWTKFTMEEAFYAWRLRDLWLEVMIPDDTGRDIVHDVIYNELCVWEIKDDSRDQYIAIIEKMAVWWAQWVILWCTEIMLLIADDDVSIPAFDTTSLHAKAAVDFMLA